MRQIETISSIIVCLVFGCPCFAEQPALGATRVALEVLRTTSSLANDMITTNRSTADHINAQSSDSGVEGTTYFKVISGVPGGGISSRPASIEFAVAPIENDAPSYSQSIFMKSDELGKFKIPLRPGKYWLGPKDKALDPVNYIPASVSVGEETVVVKQGGFTKTDVFQVGYGP